MEWLFNGHFYLSTPLGHIPVVAIFVMKEKRSIYPCFPRLFIQFSEIILAASNESTWILRLLANWRICNFTWFLGTFVHAVGFLEQPSHLHILVKVFIGFFTFQSQYFHYILVQSKTKCYRQILGINQNSFFYGMFYSWFFATF